MARTTTAGTMPEFMTSPILAEFLAAELDQHAGVVETHAAENGRSRIDAARVRSIRGAMAQLAAYHVATEDGA